MAPRVIERFPRLRMPSRAALAVGVVLSLCVGCGSERDELDLVVGEWRPDGPKPTSVIHLGRYMPPELYGDVLRNDDSTPTLVLIAPSAVGAFRLVKVEN